MDSVEFKVQLAPFVVHLIKEMVVQTPRTRIEEIVSGISRSDQEKIMGNVQRF